MVLLSAPPRVLLDRIATRTTNDYGKTPAERELILANLAEIEPVLRAGATHEVDTTQSLDDVVRELVAIGQDEAT